MLTLKRLFDVAVASTMLVAAAPVMAVTAAVVYADVGRPLLFRQRRVGLRNQIFELVKFRTMREASDRNGQPLPDGERLSKLGKLIRGSSLDELPQLINVLRGDMSLVGPRPLLIEYLARYSPTQARRHEVKPGITGLAQISGRNGISWPERLALDVYYVDHASFWFDMKILIRTFSAVVTSRGVSAPGQATVQPFQGEQ